MIIGPKIANYSNEIVPFCIIYHVFNLKLSSQMTESNFSTIGNVPVAMTYGSFQLFFLDDRLHTCMTVVRCIFTCRPNIMLRVKERPYTTGLCDSALDSYEKVLAYTLWFCIWKLYI